jgi:hypothetical protein
MADCQRRPVWGPNMAPTKRYPPGWVSRHGFKNALWNILAGDQKSLVVLFGSKVCVAA